MIDVVAFPNLTLENHRVTSPATTDYNCVAWAANDVKHWWQPGRYWPTTTDSDAAGVTELKVMFAALGYELCANGSLNIGFEKIALYGLGSNYTHAARQLPNGKWTSKLGRSEDIEHDSPDDLAGGVYGNVLCFMSRSTDRS